MATSGKKSVSPAEKIGIWHCAPVLQKKKSEFGIAQLNPNFWEKNGLSRLKSNFLNRNSIFVVRDFMNRSENHGENHQDFHREI